MSDLFTENARSDTTEKPARFDWLTEFAKAKFDAPNGWEWFRFERKEYDKPHEYILLTGAVCAAKYEKGKRKGQKNWKLRDKATEAQYAIRVVELEQFQRDWQQRTGLCFECYGTGEQWSEWSAQEGTKYRPCSHCGATGNARPKVA